MAWFINRSIDWLIVEKEGRCISFFYHSSLWNAVGQDQTAAVRPDGWRAISAAAAAPSTATASIFWRATEFPFQYERIFPTFWQPFQATSAGPTSVRQNKVRRNSSLCQSWLTEINFCWNTSFSVIQREKDNLEWVVYQTNQSISQSNDVHWYYDIFIQSINQLSAHTCNRSVPESAVVALVSATDLTID